MSDDKAPDPRTQDHAHQGQADLGYGYGSGDYGFQGENRDHEGDTLQDDGRDPPNDAALETTVRGALSTLPITALDVRVERGEAYLYGIAVNRDAMRLAAEAALAVDGVKDVYNSLRTPDQSAGGEVDPRSSRDPDESA
ncbi:BON domain-containing protein [Deinococcus yavapaiensis]|uniref:BON domain-containing protein n=1 Tax=Deinococcus yavapaiensis KR-236 TaxID=694435 RepID=A0A318SBY9_9DEIO|nr:BON domain-containing protein [Deinococcus yavapaiensis]PYE54814.1 BON domain-containing protein [Deinococcus yavapaiensis KR-236]